MLTCCRNCSMIFSEDIVYTTNGWFNTQKNGLCEACDEDLKENMQEAPAVNNQEHSKEITMGQNIIHKNGVKYLVCEPNSYLRENYELFRRILQDGRVFAVNLDSGKLVTIKPTANTAKGTQFLLSGTRGDGFKFEAKLSNDWDVAQLQINDHTSNNLTADARFAIVKKDANGDDDTVFQTSMKHCRNVREFFRQVQYAYNTVA